MDEMLTIKYTKYLWLKIYILADNYVISSKF